MGHRELPVPPLPKEGRDGAPSFVFVTSSNEKGQARSLPRQHCSSAPLCSEEEGYFCSVESLTIPPAGPAFSAFAFLTARVLSTHSSAVFRSWRACRRIAALDVGFFAPHQVEVGHGVVVVRTQFDGFVQHLHAFFDEGGVLGLQLPGRLSCPWQRGSPRASGRACFALPCAAGKPASNR